MKTLQEMTLSELAAEMKTAKGLRRRVIRGELAARKEAGKSPLEAHEEWLATQSPLSTVFRERERNQVTRELARSPYVDDREIAAVVGPAGKIVDRMKARKS